MNYVGFVYEWTNIKNGKKYIGSHLGNINDGYIGSGIYFRKAYDKNPEYFERSILEYVYEENKILLTEQSYLDKIDNISKNEKYYNISSITGGGNKHSHLELNYKKEMYSNLTKSSIDSMKSKTKEQKDIIANKKRDRWKSKPEMLKKHSENTRKRRLYEESIKTENEKNIEKEKYKKIYKNRSEENIKYINEKKSNSVKNWHSNMSIEEKNKISQKISITIKNMNKKWMHHPLLKENIAVPDIYQQYYIMDGYVYGLIRKKR